MSVYVDSERTPYRGMKMSHMIADSIEELHAMADKLGLKRAWFQPGPPKHALPHYDICDSNRLRALSMGAVGIGRRELVGFIRRSRTRPEERTEMGKSRWATDCYSRSGTAHLFQHLDHKPGEYLAACGHRRAKHADLQPEDQSTRRCARCQKLQLKP